MREKVSMTLALLAGLLAGIVIVGAGARSFAPTIARNYIGNMPRTKRLRLAYKIARGKI